jgi:hypothetical protein
MRSVVYEEGGPAWRPPSRRQSVCGPRSRQIGRETVVSLIFRFDTVNVFKNTYHRVLATSLPYTLIENRCKKDNRKMGAGSAAQGSPSKYHGVRSGATARLVVLSGALVVLGLLAPTKPLQKDLPGAVAAQGSVRVLRQIGKVDMPGDHGRQAHTPSIISSQLDIAHRAGCCGAVSPPACPGPYPHLLVYVAVPNAWADADRRHPLRAQWARSLALMDKRLKEKGRAGPPPATVLHFLIGLQGLSDREKAAVTVESAAHHDLLILPDVTDKDVGEPVSRSSTTLKVMHSMAYAASHYTFDFYARVGDDAYLRVDYLAELVLIDHAYPVERAYIGYKFGDHPIAGSHSTHNFIVGMGFFLTQDLTRYVCRAQDVLLDGFPEDGIVGSWFVGTKVDVIHEPRFHDIDHVTTVAYAPCSNASLLLHHMWSRKNWEDVDGEGLLKC